MPDVTVKLSDGTREVTVEINGSDDEPLARAEDTAVRLYGVVAHTPPDPRAGFGDWSLSSDTERSPEE
ncbi:VCBS domain-containing protein [Streptomyces tuirus]|uniref:VCBS domain-containing protein n=1 Tax=Streptomyces tuirus TaxID=68278 RepID=A0A941F9D1_9ACTN|nr:VCBS domain-containing protein [Streptomyces tuirus]